MPNSFVFDPNRCTGCHACRVACAIENELPPEQSWRRVETFNTRHRPGIPLFHLSLACNHCAEPACLYACPALAYRRDQHTGAVLLDERKCIGCKYCGWACPFDAPVYDETRGTMSKCTFCHHRLQEGLKPACAALCPTRALDFADLSEAELVNDIDGFPVSDLEPRISIVPLKPGRRLPVMSTVVPQEANGPDPEPAPSGISLRSEWSLMLFTMLSATLVAFVASAVAGAVSLRPLPFVAGAVLTLGFAQLHLGRPWRSHRAVLNLHRSWLSREVFSLSAFVIISLVYLWLLPDNMMLGGLAILF
ncbi:MAG: 4Fe-4S binding protein, partial [Gemmatimonadales bacterium]